MAQIVIVQIPPQVPGHDLLVGGVVGVDLADGDVVGVVVQETMHLTHELQWDDERFERDGQLDLFDRLGTHDKRLHAYPGQREP